MWILSESSHDPEQTTAIFSLDTSVYPASFPKVVRAEYTVTLTEVSLQVALRSINGGDSDFSFKMFYHNYIAISSAKSATISGLKQGDPFKDNNNKGTPGVWQGGDLKMDQRIGR